jgi:hypothetical protein
MAVQRGVINAVVNMAAKRRRRNALEPSIDSSSRRNGAPAVHSLHRFVFSVPDLGAAVKFYTDFGLDVRRMGGRVDLRTFGNAHRWGEVLQGQGPKRLEYLSFGAYPED